MWKDWGLGYVTGCDAMWFCMCYNTKIKPADSGFSDVTFYLNTCRRLEIWTVDVNMNWMLWILCTPRRLYSGHSELLPRNKAAGACNWPPTHFYVVPRLWMSGVMPPILQYLYDLTVNTLYLIVNRERCEGKTAVVIFWLGLCNISTVTLRVVKFNIQTRYLTFKYRTPYHWYHFLPVGICGLQSGFLS